MSMSDGRSPHNALRGSGFKVVDCLEQDDEIVRFLKASSDTSVIAGALVFVLTCFR